MSSFGHRNRPDGSGGRRCDIRRLLGLSAPSYATFSSVSHSPGCVGTALGTEPPALGLAQLGNRLPAMLRAVSTRGNSIIIAVFPACHEAKGYFRAAICASRRRQMERVVSDDSTRTRTNTFDGRHLVFCITSKMNVRCKFNCVLHRRNEQWTVKSVGTDTPPYATLNGFSTSSTRDGDMESKHDRPILGKLGKRTKYLQ